VRQRLSPLLCALVITFAVGLAGCSSGAHFALDGSPRYPNAQGLLTAANKKDLLVGQDEYAIGTRLITFSTYNLTQLPLGAAIDRYVQVGLHGHTAVWIAVVGIATSGQPVIYTGTLLRIDAHRRAIFSDGTVLQLAPQLHPAEQSGLVIAEIDAMTGQVTALVANG